MKEFSENISHNGQLLAVSLTPIFTVKGRIYFVTLKKGREDYFFDMQRTSEGHWCIVDPQHQWLKNIEKQLSELINHHLYLQNNSGNKGAQ